MMSTYTESDLRDVQCHGNRAVLLPDGTFAYVAPHGDGQDGLFRHARAWIYKTEMPVGERVTAPADTVDLGRETPGLITEVTCETLIGIIA